MDLSVAISVKFRDEYNFVFFFIFDWIGSFKEICRAFKAVNISAFFNLTIQSFSYTFQQLDVPYGGGNKTPTVCRKRKSAASVVDQQIGSVQL